MWKYEKPEMELIQFQLETVLTDNITTSTEELPWIPKGTNINDGV